MKKCISPAALAATLFLAPQAHSGQQIARKIASIPENSVKIGCQAEGKDCAEPPEVVTEFEGRNEVPTAYCNEGSKVVSGSEVKFCKVPRPVML